MDIQKEPFLSKDQYECLEFLKTWGLNKVEFDENKQIIGITRQSHCDLSTREIELIMRAWQAKSKVVPEKDAVIKKLSDQLYAQEMKASAARVLCETACELLDGYAHQDAMVILNDLEQAMKEPAND